MNCCKYSSGDLQARVTIERKAQVPDGMGGNTETWSADPVGGVWAKWQPMRGAEAFRYMRVGSNVSVMAVIRFRGDGNGAPYYTGGDRVTYKGREYGIVSVVDVDDESQWLELMLQEGAPS